MGGGGGEGEGRCERRRWQRRRRRAAVVEAAEEGRGPCGVRVEVEEGRSGRGGERGRTRAPAP